VEERYALKYYLRSAVKIVRYLCTTFLFKATSFAPAAFVHVVPEFVTSRLLSSQITNHASSGPIMHIALVRARRVPHQPGQCTTWEPLVLLRISDLPGHQHLPFVARSESKNASHAQRTQCTFCLLPFGHRRMSSPELHALSCRGKLATQLLYTGIRTHLRKTTTVPNPTISGRIMTILHSPTPNL
jgi:hypothetical protein